MTSSQPTPTRSFFDRPDLYDAMIDWPARLNREEPLYRWLFHQVGARRVLDIACGTGRHAALFHAWGLEVEGGDVSPAMIAFCREKHGESDTLRWRCRSFDEPVTSVPPFDVALCKGNSLALARDLDSVTRAVRSMMQAVRPGGACLVQLLNLFRLPEGCVHWQKKQRMPVDGQSCLLLKGIHRHQGEAHVETVIAVENSHPPRIETHASRLLLIEEGTLRSLLLDEGGGNLEVYGSVAREPYRRDQSPDFILVARKT